MLQPVVLIHVFRRGSSAVAYRDSLPVFASNCISPPHLWTPSKKDMVFFFFCSAFGHRSYNFHFVAAVSWWTSLLMFLMQWSVWCHQLTCYLMPCSTKNDARHQKSLTKAGIDALRILNSFWMLQGKTNFCRGLTYTDLHYVEAALLSTLGWLRHSISVYPCTAAPCSVEGCLAFSKVKEQLSCFGADSQQS